jgi:hypothetical protein
MWNFTSFFAICFNVVMLSVMGNYFGLAEKTGSKS